MNKVVLFLSISILLINKVYSQNLVYIESEQRKTLFLVNLDDCSVKTIGEMPEIMLDIAMSPDGQLYGVTASSKLYKIDRNTGAGEYIADTPLIFNALVYGANDSLYAAGINGEIYRIKPATGVYTFLGRCGYYSGGDLTFYKGSLYLAGRFGALIAINLNDVTKSKLVGSMGVNNIFGIITVGTGNCDGPQSKIYAIGGNIIYDLDINTTTVLEKCKLNIQNIGGAASLAESSKVTRKDAGKDSTLTFCFGLETSIDLQMYLPNIEKGGIWKDIDKSNSLSNNIINLKSLKKGSYRFQYILGENVCADTSQITINIAAPIILAKIDMTKPSCGGNSGSITVFPSDTTNNIYTYSINNQFFQKDNKLINLY